MSNTDGDLFLAGYLMGFAMSDRCPRDDKELIEKAAERLRQLAIKERERERQLRMN